MTLRLIVIDDNGTTIVGEILPGQFRSADGRHVPLGGIGTVELPQVLENGAVNPAVAYCVPGRLIRFLSDDVAIWQMEIEELNDVPLSPDEERGEILTVTGRDWLSARADKVCIRPDRGTENEPWHTTRWFNFAADRLRDDDPDGPQGAWPFSYGQLPNYDTDNYFGRPEGFTDTAGPAGTGPEWLWEDDTRTAFAAGGVSYFRQRFTLDDEYDMIFEFAADDEGELWVDDVPLCNTKGVYLGGCVKAGVRLSAGEHLLSALGRNLNELRAGVVYAGWSVSNSMPDSLLVRSDSSLARVLAYPADPPGFTPTEVIRLVVDELQDLGRLLEVGFSFISASDTDSQEIDEVTDLACRAPADTLLTLLLLLNSTYLDIDGQPEPTVDADLCMDAWIRGTRGADVSASVIFTKGTCRRIAHTTAFNEKATVALVEGNGFASFEVEHPDAGAGNYFEVPLNFGDASRASAAKWALEYLNEVSAARKGISLELGAGGPVPYDDFDMGDTIGLLGADGSTIEDHRVAAIGFRAPDGNAPERVVWAVDLDQPSMTMDERLSSILRRQTPGAAGGRTILPTPVAPQFLANEKGSEKVHTWQWDGDAGNIVLKKNGTAITGATITSPAAGTTSKVTVTDAARKYVKGSDKLTFSVGGGVDSPAWVPPEGRWIQEFRATRDAGEDTTTITVSVT